MGSQRVGHDWATELNWNHRPHTHKSFSTTWDIGLKQTNKQTNKKKDGEIGKCKWNWSTEYELEKWDKLEKSKRWSYSSVVLKYGWSLES